MSVEKRPFPQILIHYIRFLEHLPKHLVYQAPPRQKTMTTTITSHCSPSDFGLPVKSLKFIKDWLRVIGKSETFTVNECHLPNSQVKYCHTCALISHFMRCKTRYRASHLLTKRSCKKFSW